jgi:hypothetical protein
LKEWCAALALAGLIAGCGSSGGSGRASGQLSLNVVWQRLPLASVAGRPAPAVAVPPGFTTELPAAVTTITAVFQAPTLQCCVKIDPRNPQLIGAAGDHVLVLNQLPVGSATVTLAGFAGAVGSAPSGVSGVCTTQPVDVGAPCDITPAAPDYQSNTQPVVITAGIQFDTPLIELFAVGPPTAVPTATSSPPPPTATSAATPTETPSAILTDTPTPSVTSPSTATETPVQTVTATNTPPTENATPTPTATPANTATATQTASPPAGGSILVFENLQVTDTMNPIVSLTTTGNSLANAHCFYADTSQPACRTFGFNVQLRPGASVQWQASAGGPVPGTGVPFSGELICVEVDVTGAPISQDSLAGTAQIPGQSPVAAASISGFDTNDGNNALCLGTGVTADCPSGAEYGDCPAGIDPARIQTCWSQSEFTFECASSATATPTPTVPTLNTPLPTRTVAPLPDGGPLSAYAPASMLVYPYLAVDSSKGVDSVVQLTNTSSNPMMLHCYYEDTTAHCSNQAAACTTAADCPAGGTCVPGWSDKDFLLTLAGTQLGSWRVSQGLSPPPTPPATGGFPIGLVPSVPEDPFVGLLRCFVVDDSNVALGNNALVGEATIERFVSGTALDVTKYNAVAIPALNTGNGDNLLVLGDEYAACPSALALNAFFDGAGDPAFAERTIATTLALVPCSVDYARAQPSRVTVQYQIVNELGQSFSASHGALQGQAVELLTDIAPVFSVSMAGSLTGQIRITGVEGGILGVALEAHQNASSSQSVGLNLNVVGNRFSSDLVVLPPAQ